MHTVSFYRSQKPPNTPVARVTIEPRIAQQSLLESTESPRATISQRILRLQEEAAKQMPVIQQASLFLVHLYFLSRFVSYTVDGTPLITNTLQASQALNLCRSTKEFFGSSEQVPFQLFQKIHPLKLIFRLRVRGCCWRRPTREQLPLLRSGYILMLTPYP